MVRSFGHPDDIPADVSRVSTPDGWVAERHPDEGSWRWHSDPDGQVFNYQSGRLDLRRHGWHWRAEDYWPRLFPVTEVAK